MNSPTQPRAVYERRLQQVRNKIRDIGQALTQYDRRAARFTREPTWDNTGDLLNWLEALEKTHDAIIRSTP